MTADRSGAPLRFATFLAPNMLPVYRFLADQIAHQLSRPVQLVVGSSFDQFERGQVDLGVICGLPYVWLADRRPPPVEPLAAPVLAGDRYAGRPIYYSDVIVPHDSPISCLEELRGCTWAYNEPTSHSGHTVTLHALVRMGAQPGFFTRWSRPASTRKPFVSSTSASWTRPRSTPRSWPSSSAVIKVWPGCGWSAPSAHRPSSRW